MATDYNRLKFKNRKYPNNVATSSPKQGMVANIQAPVSQPKKPKKRG
jgi:hypothetical protein